MFFQEKNTVVQKILCQPWACANPGSTRISLRAENRLGTYQAFNSLFKINELRGWPESNNFREDQIQCLNKSVLKEHHQEGINTLKTVDSQLCALAEEGSQHKKSPVLTWTMFGRGKGTMIMCESENIFLRTLLATGPTKKQVLTSSVLSTILLPLLRVWADQRGRHTQSISDPGETSLFKTCHEQARRHHLSAKPNKFNSSIPRSQIQ